MTQEAQQQDETAARGREASELNELLACPFCGMRAQTFESEGCDWGAGCTSCGAMIAPGFNWNERDAIEAWNRRANGLRNRRDDAPLDY